MTNHLNEKRSYAVIIAAVIATLVVLTGGLISGLVCAVQKHKEIEYEADNSKIISQSLLTDAAYNLKSSMSALRLCNENEPAQNINKTALVHAVRAETALECDGGNFADNRSKEAFLNDIATVLHSYTPEQTMEMADMLYKYSAEFYAGIINGGEFRYDGELIKSNGGEDESVDVTDADIDAAAELVRTALETDVEKYMGEWNGHLEFNIERGGVSGYAIVCKSKILEFSFMREGEGNVDEASVEEAKTSALECASACGYDDLTVRFADRVGRSITVIMCRSVDGALACDDYASAVVFGGNVVAFAAGNCDCRHTDVPKPEKSEAQARKATREGSSGDGVLVVRTMNGKERICYEYRYELDDGVHYVYVCAQSGKQIEVK